MASKTARLWRESATLIIISRSALRNTNQPFDYRVLMLQRSSKSRFMPGNYVFPGGMIDNADYDGHWMDLYHKAFKAFSCDFTSLSDIKGPRPPIFKKSHTSVPSEVAFRICAIRETFEESGVLLLKKLPGSRAGQPQVPSGCVSVEENLSTQEISQWRTDVHKNPTRFIELCRHLSSVPDVWSLGEWSNWRTPLDLKIRFDTAFFMSFCDHEPTAQHDEKETVHSQWLTPVELIMNHFAKKSKLGPPQLYIMLQLCRMTKWDELKTFQENRAKEGIIQLLPVRLQCSDAIITLLPGDDMYDQLLANAEMVIKNEDWDKHGIVPKQEFTETHQELEKGIVNFHRIIFEKSKPSKMKMNCRLAGGLPMPLTDVSQLMCINSAGDVKGKL